MALAFASGGGGGGGGFANPMTTAGDLIYENASPAPDRLGVGLPGQVLGVVGGLPAYVYPPGYELAYTQNTATINVVSTTEAAGTLIFSPGAITFDGGPVMCDLFAWITTPNGTTCSVALCLFEGATELTRLVEALVTSSSGNNQLLVTARGQYRFTPTAGAHTYTVTAFANITTGTPAVQAGNGGVAGIPPAFVRFTKV